MPGHTVTEWLLLLLLGGLAGAIGQLARVIVGLKKVNDVAEAKDVSSAELIEPARLFTSIAIGFTAGALASMAIADEALRLTTQQVLGLAAAGYAGADFIEGFMKKEKALKEPADPPVESMVRAVSAQPVSAPAIVITAAPADRGAAAAPIDTYLG
jgi:hypothetical protein